MGSTSPTSACSSRLGRLGAARPTAPRGVEGEPQGVAQVVAQDRRRGVGLVRGEHGSRGRAGGGERAGQDHGVRAERLCAVAEFRQVAGQASYDAGVQHRPPLRTVSEELTGVTFPLWAHPAGRIGSGRRSSTGRRCRMVDSGLPSVLGPRVHRPCQLTTPSALRAGRGGPTRHPRTRPPSTTRTSERCRLIPFARAPRCSPTTARRAFSGAPRDPVGLLRPARTVFGTRVGSDVPVRGAGIRFRWAVRGVSLSA